MKKYALLLFGCALIASSTVAQTTVVTMTGSAATLTNAATVYVAVAPTQSYEQIAFQPLVTKVSGTIAGTATLQYSNDNTNFINTDTLTLTNITTNTAIYPKTYNPAYYYRIKFTGSGTMVGTVSGYCLVENGRGSRSIPSANMLSSYGLTSDTCTNAATTYLGITVTQGYNRISMQAVVTKISGTVAGTVTLQGSEDGTNFITVNSSYVTATTLAPTDQATNTKMFIVTGCPYKYYRFSYTGSGTMSATIKGYLVANK